VLLLHGLLGSGRNLATLARMLAEAGAGLDVVTLDLTGHGSSPPLPPAADSATLAADVLATARALALPEPLALVGHSLGGRVALRAGQLAPSAIASIVVLDIAPGPLGNGGSVARVIDVLQAAPAEVATLGEARARLIADGLDAAIADWLLLNLERDGDRYRWRVDREAVAALHARISAEDLWPIVEARRPWALRCVRGGASPYVSEADRRRLAAADCPVTTVDGAGHFLHAEHPRAAAAAVLSGLR
jgi:pimeloyl-ACP methyl ester carboxylesterase